MAYLYAHNLWGDTVPAPETNTRKVVRRLEADGWRSVAGGEHDKFTHPARPGVVIVVPRHRELSIGVARNIAKLADWK